MPDLYIFKAQVGMFDPVALQNHNVCIRYQQNAPRYGKVDFLESIPPFQCVNVGALAAFGISGRVNVVNLEMPDSEFGLFRWYPIDDVQIRMYHPAGIAKFQLRNLQVPVDMNIVIRDPNLTSTEIAVWEDNRPAVEAVNANAVGVGGARLIAIGYRFHMIEISDEAYPMSQNERRVIDQVKTEYPNVAVKTLLRTAFEQERLPVTNVWCSGRGVGD